MLFIRDPAKRLKRLLHNLEKRNTLASKKFAETKGPFIVWLFVTLYFAISIAFSGSSNGMLPQDVTISVVLSLLISMAIGWGVILVFLVIFWRCGRGDDL